MCTLSTPAAAAEGPQGTRGFAAQVPPPPLPRGGPGGGRVGAGGQPGRGRGRVEEGALRMRRAATEAVVLLATGLALLAHERGLGEGASRTQATAATLALMLAAAAAEGLGLLAGRVSRGANALRFRRAGLHGLSPGLLLVPWVLLSCRESPGAVGRASGASLLGLALALAWPREAAPPPSRPAAAALILVLLGLGGLRAFMASLWEAALAGCFLAALATVAAPGALTAGEAWAVAHGAAAFLPIFITSIVSGEASAPTTASLAAAEALRGAALARGLILSALILLPVLFAMGLRVTTGRFIPAVCATATLLSGAAALSLADRLESFPELPHHLAPQAAFLPQSLPWVVMQVADNTGVLLYWTVTLGAGLVVQALFTPRGASPALSGRRIFLRKNFHLLAVALFLPAHITRPAILQVALAGALLLFVAGECLRLAGPTSRFGGALNDLFTSYLDDRDARGRLCISHLSLLLGMALPVWLEGGAPRSGGGGPAEVALRPMLPAFAGYVALGAVDVAAVFVGKPWGRHLLFSDSPKSAEGTAAAAVAAAAVLGPLRNFSRSGLGVVGVAAAAGAGAAFEAVTDQMDNIFVPLQLFCVLKALC